MFEPSEERASRLNLKRNADGQPICLCIKNCLKNICMCQRKNLSCSKYCKCSAAVCTNRHSPVSVLFAIGKYLITCLTLIVNWKDIFMNMHSCLM